MNQNDRGISMIWVAMLLFFLMGAAALAVDAAGAYNTARTDQNTADLACLAGVKELPDDPANAIDYIVEYVGENWPAMEGQTLTSLSGTEAQLSDGTNTVDIDVAFDGDASKAHVVVTEEIQTFFGRIVGLSEITVSQEAFCRVTTTSTGGGSLPFGALPGGFNGNLQNFNPCPAGNCGPIDIPRTTPNGGGPQFVENLATGADRYLEAWLGPLGPGAKVCNTVGAGDTCHILTTNNGVSAGQLGEGASRRIKNYAGAGCSFVSKGVTMNCDTPGGVLTGNNANSLQRLTSVFPIGSPPGFWNTSLHGPYNATNTANHYYFNSDLAFCDHPRLGSIPIVTDDMDWDLGDGPAAFNGNTTVKVVGFLWVVIVDPNDAGDFQGNNNLKTASTVVVWFGPNADQCGAGGIPFDPANPGQLIKDVKLVDDVN